MEPPHLLEQHHTQGHRYLYIELYPQARVVAYHWLGLVSDDLILSGSERVIHHLLAEKPKAFVADFRHMEGGWGVVGKWLAEIAVPKVSPMQAKIALVRAQQEDVLTEMSFFQLTPHLDKNRLQLFFDYDQALAWALAQ
jgi:hypothetical protein